MKNPSLTLHSHRVSACSLSLSPTPPSVHRELSGSYLRSRCVFTSTQSLTLISKTGNSAQPYLTQWGFCVGYEESPTRLWEEKKERDAAGPLDPLGLFLVAPTLSLLPASSGNDIILSLHIMPNLLQTLLPRDSL